MVRQYRIDRLNGLEVLVCEIFRKHTYTQSEYDAFFKWKEDQEKIHPNSLYLDSDFKLDLFAFLEDTGNFDESGKLVRTFYGLSEPIPMYDYQPHIVLRGVIVNNRIASLQVDYSASTLVPEVLDAVNKFYGVMDSRHWRDMVDHQHQKYGSLFESVDD